MHRTCPLLGVLGRRRVRGGPPQGCTALARFLAFLAAGEYGARRRKNGALSAPPPQGFTALARFLAFLAAGQYGAPPLPRGAPPLPASWPSWPPASMGREGARTARCRRPPPGVHRPCPLLGLLGRRRVWGEKAQERRVVGAPPQGCTALARFLAFLAAGEYGARRRV